MIQAEFQRFDGELLHRSPSVGMPIIAGDGYFYLPCQYAEYSAQDGDNGFSATAEHSRVLRVELAGDSSTIALEDLSSSTFAGDSFSESVSNASMPSLITNADQGALASYAINSSASTETNGDPTSSSNKVSFQLAITSGTSVNPKVQMASVPGQQYPVQPALQRQDGNFVGTLPTSVGTSMIAFTPSRSPLFTVANDTPQIATSDNGVIDASGITYDQNGNAIGQLGIVPTHSASSPVMSP